MEGQGARCLRVACRDFLRKVVLSDRGVARLSLWVSVIWREGRMSALWQLIPPLPSDPGPCSERRGIQSIRTMEGDKDPLSN